jgi:hypothetical protein
MTKSELAKVVLKLWNSGTSCILDGVFDNIPPELHAEAELVKKYQTEVAKMFRDAKRISESTGMKKIYKLFEKICRLRMRLEREIILWAGDLGYPRFYAVGTVFEGSKGWRKQVRSLDESKLFELLELFPIMVAICRHIE